MTLHVIGTMNIADRSLALMDLALRRRFAFITLAPQLGAAWRTWVSRTFSIDDAFLRLIESRVTALNNQIASDSALGPQYQIGHSYVIPPKDFPLQDAPAWYRQVVESEIGPLIQEYWFDSADKAQEAKQGLLEGV